MTDQSHRGCLRNIDVLILAGGLGTRLKSLLGDVPKLLAPIGGRPYVEILFDWLRSYGARRVIISLGHRAEVVTRYLSEHTIPDLELETVVEPQPLGTAGAIRFARPVLQTDPVMVLNGDSYVSADLCSFLERFDTTSALASILCALVEDAGRYGRVIVNRDGIILGFVEKDQTFQGRSAINAGVYLLSAVMLDDIASSNAVSLERDVLECAPAGTLSAFVGNFEFIDIGTPESFIGASSVFERLVVRDKGLASST